MRFVSIITFEIKPGRVPDARALLRGAPPPEGLVAWKFVEIGVVNTLIGFLRGPDPLALADWLQGVLAGQPDFLRGVQHTIYRGDLPGELAQSPAVLLRRGVGPLRPLTGDVTQSLTLSCTDSLDAALAEAILLRETTAHDLLLLIPEAL